VTFDASNSTVPGATIVSYAWDFGDGNKSAIGIPLMTHSYAEAKEHNVTLNVTSSYGDWDVESQIVNVTELAAPKAAFTWLPQVPEAGQPVEFNASESTPDGGEITSYTWDFGDETVQTGFQPIVVHEYQHFGMYTVLLNTTDSDGFSDVINHSVTVIEKPLADFFLSPKEPRVCNVVVFNASISDPRGGEIMSFEWNFGNGSDVQYGVAVTHQFGKMGEHVVSLNVTDSENLWDVRNITVRILPHIADLNEDGVVDVLDITIFARAYGSVPGQERWNQRADLDSNKVINILDGVVIARSYNMCIEPFDC
jgi:PKD repeat protein